MVTDWFFVILTDIAASFFLGETTNGHAHPHGQVTIPMHRQQPQPQVASTDVKKATMKAILSSHVYDVPEGDDYLAIYETLDRKEVPTTPG